MPTTTSPYRYYLPKKSVKTACPQCAHPRTFSRYVDGQTGELLPEQYGRCDRESNCGYSLSPYHKGPSGLSYADEMREDIPSQWFKWVAKQKRAGSTQQGVAMTLQRMQGATPEQAERVVNFIFSKPSLLPLSPPPAIHTLPQEMFTASLGHYERNQLARLLSQRFGPVAAQDLLHRFQVGTSNRWPGACVFWYIDEHDRKRGGQIKVFDSDWHTVKYTDRAGETRSKTSWVHSAIMRRLEREGKPLPDWLTEYDQQAVRAPCLFGLPQLRTAPTDHPIAVVEAPKTAIVCTYYLPDFIWLAVGGLSYFTVNTEAGKQRLAPLRHRKVMLFPDLSKDSSAYARWRKVAEELNAVGWHLSVSTYLEERATDQQKAQGLDLADFLLHQHSPLYTSTSPSPAEQKPPRAQPTLYWQGELVEGEVLPADRSEDYPADWDAPSDKTPPKLLISPNRSTFAACLGIEPYQLPLYRLVH